VHSHLCIRWSLCHDIRIFEFSMDLLCCQAGKHTVKYCTTVFSVQKQKNIFVRIKYQCVLTFQIPVFFRYMITLIFQKLLFMLNNIPTLVSYNDKCWFFLAHLSTKCSWWAIVVSGCPSSVVVRRASTFDVYTLETTFVTQFWWNYVRMFASTISRPSSNMGYVGSKTRSPGQIIGNPCLHSRGHICDLILMKLCQNVCFNNI